MRDPLPGNIDGSKVETHEFKHVINWGYVTLGLAGLGVVYLLWKLRVEGENIEHDSDESEPEQIV